MAITVYLNQVRAGTVDTDRLVTYQPLANRSVEVESCIDMVVAVKGHYNGESSDMSPACDSRFDKFMAHVSFGNSDKVPLPGLERYQGSLECLEAMVEKAKAEGLTDLYMWVSVVNPTGTVVKGDSDSFLHRYKRLVKLMDQVEDMIDRLGCSCDMISHPFGLLKLELRADGAFSSYDGLNAEKFGSVGLALGAYQTLVCTLRRPDRS